MVPSNTQASQDTITAGDIVERTLIPGDRCRVNDIGICRMSDGTDFEHPAYQITDPTGRIGWICAQAVRKVTG